MMADPTRTESFLEEIPVFSAFGQVLDPDLYLPVPAGWIVGMADVVSSTHAIEEGHYKKVNMAGAAVISAVSNALGNAPYPFVFGGDGASFVLPGDLEAAARQALARTAAFVAETYGLELRIACVPVAAIRAAGFDVRVGRFAASPDLAYAMFSGGGLIWAEEQMKAGAFGVPAAPPGSRPDLTGLSCRFEPMPSRRGTMLSIIVRAARLGPDGSASWPAYRATIEAIIRMVEESPDMARPVPEGGPPLRWPSGGLDLEPPVEAAGRRSLTGRLKWLVSTAFAFLVFRLGIPVGRFRPGTYLDQLVANSDYRKYDDGLRMTIDCGHRLADRIEARLGEAAASGIVIYGLHRQGAALMTCLTPSVYRSDHIHFLDGAAGGYSAAAMSMKGREIIPALLDFQDFY